MTNDAGVAAETRTWRPPVSYQFALSILQAFIAAMITAYIWFTLWANGAPGWPALVTLPFLFGFMYRTWTASARLTPDTLIITNVLSTKRVALTDITAVIRNRRRMLRVTDRHGKAYSVTALQYDLTTWYSGLRCEVDEAADLIAAAAGLTPLPPRKERLSRGQSWLLLAGALACLAVGFSYGPLPSVSGGATHRSVGLVAAAGALWGLGAGILPLGIRAIVGHHRRSRRPPMANPGASDT